MGTDQGTDDLASDRDDPVVFDAVLHPHRSLGPVAFRRLMLALAGLAGISGLVFWAVGAWPVAGFLGVDVALLYLAFKASYRSAQMYETVRLTREELRIERVLPSGRRSRWSFQPYWMRVGFERPARPESRLTLSSHGRSLEIGRFLAPKERESLADALDDALAVCRRPAAL